MRLPAGRHIADFIRGGRRLSGDLLGSRAGRGVRVRAGRCILLGRRHPLTEIGHILGWLDRGEPRPHLILLVLDVLAHRDEEIGQRLLEFRAPGLGILDLLE